MSNTEQGVLAVTAVIKVVQSMVLRALGSSGDECAVLEWCLWQSSSWQQGFVMHFPLEFG